MVDRTQEDINQDQRIARLEQQVLELRRQYNDHAKSLTDDAASLKEHKARLDILDPLRTLLEHVEAIKDFITNIRSIRRVKE